MSIESATFFQNHISGDCILFISALSITFHLELRQIRASDPVTKAGVLVCNFRIRRPLVAHFQLSVF